MDVGVNHPYKAMIDMLLSSYTAKIQSEDQATLLFKGQLGEMDSTTYTGGNTGFTYRARSTKDGGRASIKGLLYTDFGVDQQRAILNGVWVTVKLLKAQMLSN